MSYNWLEFLPRSLETRFPEETIGAEVWKTYARKVLAAVSPLPLWLAELRAELAKLIPPPLLCPRIFVSHRQMDEKKGLRIAKLATGIGFDFWLDALDPCLNALQTKPAGSLTKDQEIFLTAGIIEIALVNCSHVIAVLTPNTRGTLWVPYEYGRVKDVPVGSLLAGAWIDPSLLPQDIPEYLVLGMVTKKEQQILCWLAAELASWPTCPGGAGTSWDDHRYPTEMLPGSEPG